MHSPRRSARGAFSCVPVWKFVASLQFWGLFGTGLAGAAFPLCAAERYTGRAYDADGALVYTETHWRFQREGHPARLVLYRCPSGLAFARKSVISDGQAAAPNFELLDGRDGYREGVRGRGADRVVYWRDKDDDSLREKRVRLPAGSVIDAGFDAWIQQQWPRLTGQSGARARFLVPSHARLLDLRIQPQAASTPGTLRLRMSWDSWLGFVAPAVRLTYDVKDRRLLTFVGIGSVRDGQGKPWPVRIEFPIELVNRKAEAAEVVAAESTPLNGRCG